MSLFSEYSDTSKFIKAKTPRGRCPSASEIARNIRHFETWSLHQGCEHVCLSDLPEGLKADVNGVLDVSGNLPRQWAIRNPIESNPLFRIATPEIISFLSDAYDECPQLFSDDLHVHDIHASYLEIVVAFTGWQRLQKMRKSKEKWSEADFVENVYNIIRSPAIVESSLRVRCSLSLPEPQCKLRDIDDATARILNAKTINPDGLIFTPISSLRSLSESAPSYFKKLKRAIATPSKTSFRDQATPCSQLPDIETFEFISSVWEDKKPVHQLLEDAYRQNRMATATALRHLHALHVDAPVFGLVWSNGTVRAHVDWWHKSEDSKTPTISSAQYKVAQEGTEALDGWSLDRPGHLLQVYFLIKNIDAWTVTKFRQRVIDGLGTLTKLVEQDASHFKCWKRDTNASATVKRKKTSRTASKKENISISISTTVQSTPPRKSQAKRTKKRSPN